MASLTDYRFTFPLELGKRMTRIAVALLVVLAIVLGAAADGRASELAVGDHEDAVRKIIVPFLQKHCVKCHGSDKQEGELSLHEFGDDPGRGVRLGRKSWRN